MTSWVVKFLPAYAVIRFVESLTSARDIFVRLPPHAAVPGSCLSPQQPGGVVLSPRSPTQVPSTASLTPPAVPSKAAASRFHSCCTPRSVLKSWRRETFCVVWLERTPSHHCTDPFIGRFVLAPLVWPSDRAAPLLLLCERWRSLFCYVMRYICLQDRKVNSFLV